MRVSGSAPIGKILRCCVQHDLYLFATVDLCLIACAIIAKRLANRITIMVCSMCTRLGVYALNTRACLTRCKRGQGWLVDCLLPRLHSVQCSPPSSSKRSGNRSQWEVWACTLESMVSVQRFCQDAQLLREGVETESAAAGSTISMHMGA